jgi:hypothetical protein
MSEWQDRVVTEKRELDEKIDKLISFLKRDPQVSPTVGMDITKYLELLERQHRAMLEYSEILGERIAAFMSAAGESR